MFFLSVLLLIPSFLPFSLVFLCPFLSPISILILYFLFLFHSVFTFPLFNFPSFEFSFFLSFFPFPISFFTCFFLLFLLSVFTSLFLFLSFFLLLSFCILSQFCLGFLLFLFLFPSLPFPSLSFFHSLPPSPVNDPPPLPFFQSYLFFLLIFEICCVCRSQHMNHIIFILFKSFSEPSCPVDGGGVILEKTTPTRIEIFYHRIKMIRQKNFLI